VGIVVQKFGGSSVATPVLIKRVADRAIKLRNAGKQVVTVVSAMGDTTDGLMELASQITERPPERELDMLLSTGEQVASALLAMAIDAKGYPAISLTGPQCGIATDDVYSRAKILNIKPERVWKELNEGKVVVVAGFQGINSRNDITTLGRGGSDTTAVALAVALGAEVCEIYTDVEGVFSADPRVVPDAVKLGEISYAEMLEMASLGAVVLQPRAVEFAAKHGVAIYVRSSFNENTGTLVREEGNMEEAMVVTGVTHDRNVAKVVLTDVPDKPGVAHRIFSVLARHGINVDMIVQITKEKEFTDLLFTVSRDAFNVTHKLMIDVKEELGASQLLDDQDVGKVSIVGAGMMSNPGVAARMFEALAENEINIEVISTSEIKISCLIKSDKVDQAVRAIHAKFGLSSIAGHGEST